ncbi:MAG: FAD-dependent oxidoreductase [bacterium]|nr:FAD-dependent oxidoreductase [bacterium]
MLVIGAGAAGLGAARRLHDMDYAVTVLEARDRIGGRVWSNRVWPGLALDMGASWIHGVKGNPLTELAHLYGVNTFKSNYDSFVAYDPSGKKLTEGQVDYIYDLFDRVMKGVDELDDDHLSMREAVEQVVRDMNLSPQERWALEFLLNVEIEEEFAADLEDLSVLYEDDEIGFGGGDALFPQGYDQLLKPLADGLDIRLNHVVQNIAYDRDGVTVTTSQGVFRARRAVVTLPLGVLKAGKVTFTPDLPKAKYEAMEMLGMGLLNKLYLRFPAVFWEKNKHLIGNMGAQRGEWPEFFNLAVATDQPVLACFIGAKAARAMEALSDEETVASAMQVLRRMYGANIPDPEAYVLTRWGQDEFACGSYSYKRPGGYAEDRLTLAESVEEVLFFAGEATDIENTATVHGALMSGRRAAQEILAVG